MLVLFETAPGYALFKVLDEGKLRDVEDIWKEFQTADDARNVVKLKAFHKFENTAEALGAATSLVECKLSKGLRKFLKAECGGETLAIADSKLGRIISEKLEINCVHNNAVVELMRGVRTQLVELIEGLSQQDLAPMSLGLSHSLCRYTLKFSPDKVDTMIVQAIGLLDELDKELNTYAMRVKEWYGWHFPELGKIIQDNIQYAKAVKLMGKRENAQKNDFSAILAEEIETEVKEAVQISMGTDISDEDMSTIQIFCEQVISLSEYRAQLFEYLRSRMKAIAPNLTVLVGELVGARLIAHAGSLVNLAKQPSSTIQILGAEKALFRALKTKHNTPKYGLIYHASLVGQAPAKIKGKIARVLAAKSALSTRFDALGESEDAVLGTLCREKVEARLRQLEGRALGKLSGVSKGKAKIEVYEKDRKKDTPGLLTAPKTYAAEADVTLGKAKKGDSSKRKKEDEDDATEEAEPPKKKKKHAAEEASPSAAASEKKKKKKKQQAEEEEAEEAEPAEEPQQEKKKKKKSEEPEAAPSSEGKKKKKKSVEAEGTGAEETTTPSASAKKKKKSVEAEDTAAEAMPSSKKKKRKANEE